MTGTNGDGWAMNELPGTEPDRGATAATVGDRVWIDGGDVYGPIVGTVTAVADDGSRLYVTVMGEDPWSAWPDDVTVIPPYPALPEGFEITVRPDIISPWYDVAYRGDHWASFKSTDEAIAYARGDDTGGGLEELAPFGSCGCVDYHMADCPLRTGGDAWSGGGF